MPKTALLGYLKLDSGSPAGLPESWGSSPLKCYKMVVKKRKNIASLKHATYKIEEKGICTITNMKRGKKNFFAFLE